MSNRAKKAQKRKAKLKKRASAGVGGANDSLLQAASELDIRECKASGDEGTGMISITAYKRISPETAVVAGFVVDLYCLGVKDSFIQPAPLAACERNLSNPMMYPYSPEDAKKLIEGAVEYAETLGFKPHKDFRKAFKIFNRVDSSLSDKEFTFGKDGKPFFFAGPRDSPSKCERIISILKESVGPDGFDFAMPPPTEIFDTEAGEWEMNKMLD